MLPFLKRNKEASVSGPVDRITREHDEESDMDSMEVAAHDLMQALDEGNIQAIAAALRAAFQIADSEPHEEGEHE